MMSYLQYQSYVINILFREEVMCTTKPYFTYIFKIKNNWGIIIFFVLKFLRIGSIFVTSFEDSGHLLDIIVIIYGRL